MKPHPFVKFVTKEIVEALDERITNKPKTSQPFFRMKSKQTGYQWFGMLPFSFKMAWKKRKRFRS